MNITSLESTYNHEFKSFYFSAEADWNLRETFAQQKSFEYPGLGHGKYLEFVYTCVVGRDLGFYLSLRHQDYCIKDDYDQTLLTLAQS